VDDERGPLGANAAGGRLIELWLRQDRERAVLVLDRAGTVLRTLAGVESVLGYTEQELAGTSVSRLFTPEDLARGLDRLEMEVALYIGHAEDDRWHVRRDGTRIWVSGTMRALWDEAGQHAGFVKVMRDRTDARTTVQTLENRVAALMRERESTQVFLATLAHELRNPLAPLVNVAQLLRLQAGSGEAPPHVRMIENQVAQLKRLVDDLVDVARLEHHKLRLRLQSVELQGLVRQAVESQRPEAQRKRQSLNCLVPPEPVTVEVDPERLVQVIVNLVGNAIKYTGEAGHIWVTANVDDREALIRVRDDGAGILPEMLPGVFDLFTQEGRTADSAGGGLGLGLSIVKELVSLHQGTVEVRSEGAGRGSEFTVRIPLWQRA
jgi:PAS domain S-box-containing protein